MMKRFATLPFILILAACATSPEPADYMLASVDGTPDSSLNSLLVVTRPTLPDYLDQPGMVQRDGDGEISVDDMHRWAAPLDTMFEDVLAADLRQRLPSSTIQKQQDYWQPKESFFIETEIEHFDMGRQSVLSAQIVIEDKRCPAQNMQPSSFHVELRGDNSREGFNQLIAQLSDRVVQEVRLKASIACPPSH
jgi:uncharacterized lipoprotein YmbA